jgi:hypothetical protein
MTHDQLYTMAKYPVEDFEQLLIEIFKYYYNY